MQDIRDKHLRDLLRPASCMPHVLKLRSNLIQEHFLLLMRFGAVERIFIGWGVEENIHQWQTQTRYLEPFSIMRPEYTRPETYLRMLSQRGVGHLQYNSKHILVNKVIRSRKFEIVAETHQIKKEGIATAAREEGVITGFHHLHLLSKRNWSIGNDDLTAIIIACRLLASCPTYRRRLSPIVVGRKR